MNIKEIINQLKELRDEAEYRSSLIIENDQEIPIEHKAKSEGYAGGYSYAILLLERFLDID